MTENGQDEGRTTRATVGRLDDLDEGTAKMVTVGETKVALIRTASGVHAIDNACPHQGYGLVTGSLVGEALTCQWHNWKFDVATGKCLMGEEDVACHRVMIDQGDVVVEVAEPTVEEEQARLWPSLRRGLADDYVGQVARDSLRLLRTGATPGQIMAEALAQAAPKADYGVGHEMAMAADCLALAEVRSGEERALPLVQGLSGLSEETRDRPAASVPTGDADVDLEAAIEGEDAEAAMASVVGQLQGGVDPEVLRHQFLRAVSNHHLSYGHGIIYTQKSFELLGRIGWDRAPDLLPHLAARITYSTREDTLPYMRKAMRAIAAVDLDSLAGGPSTTVVGGPDPERVGALLAAEEAPIDQAVALVARRGVDGLLDAISVAASCRLLNHDLDVEFDHNEPFGWLDITHGLTTANAVRWAWRHDPGPHTARLALFATWLLFDTGRSERRHGVAEGWAEGIHTAGERGLHGLPVAVDVGDRSAGANGSAGASGSDLGRAVIERRSDQAVAMALAGERESIGEALADAALNDGAGSFIVLAHLIKTVHAARAEAEQLDSSIPLAAAARFLASPRLERFVARNVAESVDFVRTGRPPRR